MPEIENVGSQERGKSRGGTRAGKNQQSSNDTGLGGIVSAPNLDSQIEKCDGSEANTQLLLGELIQRPKLTEKLLSKPPFRFLHDIIMEVIKNTKFATHLYTPQEMDSASVTDKAQKLLFLEKIITVVGIQLNTIVEAKPMKIVAGLDAQNTNNFLQLLAIAAKHMPDSINAVRSTLDKLGLPHSIPASEQQQQQQQAVVESTSKKSSENNNNNNNNNQRQQQEEEKSKKEETSKKIASSNNDSVSEKQNNSKAPPVKQQVLC
jgi:TRAF3-interacting protein 1